MDIEQLPDGTWKYEIEVRKDDFSEKTLLIMDGFPDQLTAKLKAWELEAPTGWHIVTGGKPYEYVPEGKEEPIITEYFTMSQMPSSFIRGGITYVRYLNPGGIIYGVVDKGHLGTFNNKPDGQFIEKMQQIKAKMKHRGSTFGNNGKISF